MAIKPILFNTEMVKAILDGTKTQTRRLIKAPVLYKVNEPPDRIDKVTLPWADFQFSWHGLAIGGFDLKAPYQSGDILWVRETWQHVFNHRGWHYKYKADFNDDKPLRFCGMDIAWRPSIHMPKEAARLFLRVTDVRVERLQDMTLEDCASDGGFTREAVNLLGTAPLFGALWDSTIKKADIPRFGWFANPWVWVIEFECIDKPAGLWADSDTAQHADQDVLMPAT